MSRSPARRPRPASWRFEPPTEATRDAVWRHAGPRRDADRPRARCSSDPYPLARLIAAARSKRRESRGAHRRTDYPLPDPELDGVHLVVGADGSTGFERWT